MMLLSSFAPLHAPLKASLLARMWDALGVYGRIGLILLAAGALCIGVFFGLRWLSHTLGARIWRLLLLAFTGLCGVGFIALGIWSHFLADGKGTPFKLGDQAVHVGTVLCGMGLVIGVSSLAIPYFLANGTSVCISAPAGRLFRARR